MLSLLIAAVLSVTPAGVACSDIQSLDLPGTTILSAEGMPSAPFVWPEESIAPPGTNKDDPVPIPAHCRIKMQLNPVTGSEIGVELWLPAQDWNGKFLAVGNGGWAGFIGGYTDMKEALKRGYATAGTDTGHRAASHFSGEFTVGQPEKIIDFAYRAVHLMAVRSKQIIIEHYLHHIHYSYFKGCSTGGRQGIMSATRYPGDFDAIIAGAPVISHVRMHAADVALQVYLARHPQAGLPQSKADLVNKYMMDQCDTLGTGFLSNPRHCSVDFKKLQCSLLGSRQDCLTRQQLQTVEMFYRGVKDDNGKLIYPGQPVGNEMPEKLGPVEPPRALVLDTIRFLGFQDPDYDWIQFDVNRDLARIIDRGGFIETIDPDLSAYKAHGGKLLLYHGWNDPGVSAEDTTLFYESVLQEMGEDQDDWLRLFMVPGMGHCRGGDGPHSFATLTPLEQWREQGLAPDNIMGSNPESGLTRPLCPYPGYAEYSGSGDVKDGANWTCTSD